MVDIAFVIGFLTTIYALMQVIGAVIERGSFGFVFWTIFGLGGLGALVYGYLGQAKPFGITDIPAVFVRVLAMMGF